jgi:hypothetical protein
MKVAKRRKRRYKDGDGHGSRTIHHLQKGWRRIPQCRVEMFPLVLKKRVQHSIQDYPFEELALVSMGLQWDHSLSCKPSKLRRVLWLHRKLQMSLEQ